MLVEMTPVQILSPRAELPAVVAALHRLGRVELTGTVGGGPGLAPGLTSGETGADGADGADGARRMAALRADAADLAAMLGLAETAADGAADRDWLRTATVAVPAERLDALGPGLAPLLDRIGSLQAEHESVRRHHEALAVLLPVHPDLALLRQRDLARLGLATVVLILEAPHADVLTALRTALSAATGDRFHLVGEPTGDDTLGCVLVAPHALVADVRTLLAREHIRHVPLPAGYEQMSLGHAVEEFGRRLEALPSKLAGAWSALAGRTGELAPGWRRRRSAALDELDRLEAVTLAGRTEHTASLDGWLPRRDVDELRAALAGTGSATIVTKRDAAAAGEPPVLLDNPAPVRPYQRLVSFFGLPRSGTLDPSSLTAAVLPLLFGVMVGDLVYGAVLAALGAILRRRGAARPVLRDIGSILLAGGVWAMLFGLLYGEALGSLGHQLGLPALWFYRGGPEALGTLLLLAVGIGVTHVMLGLLLGMRQARRLRRPRTLVERGGAFFLLCGLAAIAATAVDLLPGQVRTPALAVVAVTLVVAMSSRGAMGLLTVPLELLGSLGHVLSYLRLAAVGLASVYLAGVANHLAVSVPLLLGVFVAALLHLLNLALAAFSPMVQALRLHYVEFFSGFYEEGGQAFRPFGRRRDRPLSSPG
jgi:V/A-type H+/Na+-transporting ATPase subunit I